MKVKLTLSLVAIFIQFLAPLRCQQQLFGCDTAPSSYCGLNGVCGRNGLCHCDAFYQGERCETKIQGISFASGQQSDGILALYFLLLLIFLPAIFVLIYFLIRCLQKKKKSERASNVRNREQDISEVEMRKEPPVNDFFEDEDPVPSEPQLQPKHFLQIETEEKPVARQQSQQFPVKLPSIFDTEDKKFLAKQTFMKELREQESHLRGQEWEQFPQHEEYEDYKENLSDTGSRGEAPIIIRTASHERSIGSPDRSLSQDQMEILRSVRDNDAQSFHRVPHQPQLMGFMSSERSPVSGRKDFALVNFNPKIETISVDALSRDSFQKSGRVTKSREAALPGQVLTSESDEQRRSHFKQGVKLAKQDSLLRKKGATSEIELRMDRKATSEISRREENKEENRFIEQLMTKKSIGASGKKLLILAGDLGFQQSASKVIEDDEVVSIRHEDDSSQLIKRDSILSIEQFPDDSGI